MIGKWVVGTHFYMLILWGLLLAGTLYLLVVRLKNARGITQIFNLVILTLTGFQLARIAIYSIQEGIARTQTAETAPDTFLQPADTDELPDVYFILLDKYARSDALWRNMITITASLSKVWRVWVFGWRIAAAPITLSPSCPWLPN